jgi:hypothetical protein
MRLKLNATLITELLLILPISAILIVLPSSIDNNLMNGTQSGKFFFFTYSMMGILVLWSVLLFTKKGFRLPTFAKAKVDRQVSGFKFQVTGFKLQVTGIDLFLILFVGWVSFNKYLLHDIHALSLRYFELLGLLTLYFIIRTLNSRYYIYLLLAICIGGTIQAVYGNLQLWGYYPSNHGIFKMTGSFFNPGPYAGIAVKPRVFMCHIIRHMQMGKV